MILVLQDQLFDADLFLLSKPYLTRVLAAPNFAST